MAIIAYTDYKTHAGITSSAYDTILTNLVAAIEARVLRWLERDSFNSASYTEYINGDDSPIIYVRNWPITTLTSVSVRSDDQATSTALVSTDYIYGDRGRIDLTSWAYGRHYTDEGMPTVPGWGYSPTFRRGLGRVTVVYTGGYASIPGDLKQAMYEMTDTLFARRGRDGSLQSEGLGQYTWTAASMKAVDEQMAVLFSQWRAVA